MGNAGIQVEVLDLSMKHLFRLPKARDVVVQEDYNGAGSVAFKLRRRDLNTSGLLALDEGMIRVSIAGQPTPVIGLWDQDEYDLTTGEDREITCTCPGTMTLLEEAIVFPKPTKVEEDKDQRQWVDATPGAIVLDLVREAQARGALAGVTCSFTATTDSTGQPWPSKITRQWGVGGTVLATINELCDQGVLVVRMDGLRLDLAAYGRSFSDADGVRFLPSIFSSAPRTRSRVGTFSAILAMGEGGIMTQKEITLPGRRREAYAALGGVSAQAELDALAADALKRVAYAKETYSVSYVIDGNPQKPRPWQDFRAGSVVDRLPPFDAQGLTAVVVRSMAVRLPNLGGAVQVDMEIGDRSITPYRGNTGNYDTGSLLPDTPFPDTLDPQPWHPYTGPDFGVGPNIPDMSAPVITGNLGIIDVSVPDPIWSSVPSGGKVLIFSGPSPDWGAMGQVGQIAGPGRNAQIFPPGSWNLGSQLTGTSGPAGLNGDGVTSTGTKALSLTFDPRLKSTTWANAPTRSLEGVDAGDARCGLQQIFNFQTFCPPDGSEHASDWPRRFFTTGETATFGIGGDSSGGWLGNGSTAAWEPTKTLWIALDAKPYRVGTDTPLPTEVVYTGIDSAGQRATARGGLVGRAQLRFDQPITLPVTVNGQVQMKPVTDGGCIGFVWKRFDVLTQNVAAFDGDDVPAIGESIRWTGQPNLSASEKVVTK